MRIEDNIRRDIIGGGDISEESRDFGNTNKNLKMKKKETESRKKDTMGNTEQDVMTRGEFLRKVKQKEEIFVLGRKNNNAKKTEGNLKQRKRRHYEK